jgi:hypothetical protein
VEVLVSVSGESKALRRFGRLERKLGDARPVFVEIMDTLEKTNERSYGRGVKLAESTLERKQQSGHTEPLVLTGDLKASLTKTGAKGAIREISSHEMRYGTSIFYSRFQQYGTHKMTKHRVLKFTPTVRRLAKDLLRKHLLGDD